jgi:DNA modification methylase
MVLAIHAAGGHDVGPYCDSLVTDPPYGLGIAANPFRQKYEAQGLDDKPADSETIDHLRSLSTYQIIWGGNYFNLPPSQCFLIWDKVQPETFSSSICEKAWTNLRKPAKLFCRHVVSYVKEHPTEKPIELMNWCIAQLPECRLVLDPFAGSGTTIYAAKQLGKSAIGIEIEEKYCEIAAKRLSQEVFQF